MRGLWPLALFLVLSIGAWRGFDMLPAIPGDVRALLGPAPPERLISIALVVYSFSAIILILSRMMGESKASGGIRHLGYLGAFFLFYQYAGVMRENFWAVFAAGMSILCLSAYHQWVQCGELIRQERESLDERQRRREWMGE